MINVYLNYSNSIATIHQTSTCPRIHAHHSPNQRILTINLKTFRDVIKDLAEGKFAFKAEAENNDVWLEIDFGELAFEIAVVKYIIHLLGERYEPFDDLNPELHC
jgi:hypothetical protein